MNKRLTRKEIIGRIWLFNGCEILKFIRIWRDSKGGTGATYFVRRVTGEIKTEDIHWSDHSIENFAPKDSTEAANAVAEEVTRFKAWYKTHAWASDQLVDPSSLTRDGACEGDR